MVFFYPEEAPCIPRCGVTFIHPSAWKGYSANVALTGFSEGRAGLLREASCPLLCKPHPEEAHQQQGGVIVAEDPPPTNGAQEEMLARRDVDVPNFVVDVFSEVTPIHL